ncbi:hypothetical protein FACS1894216_13920 [Synergistales bacterium]|nr:hypothetical protein FACS1894216_13920 [Synergistales bacterium]
MDNITLVLLFGAGVLIGMADLIGSGALEPVYMAAVILAVVPLAFVRYISRERRARAAMLSAAANNVRSFSALKREAKLKIPKDLPMRESEAALVGLTKLGAARSMAMLIRKPLLRGKITEICDFADIVLDTIRHMPSDTPAATLFCETHLSKLIDALDYCFSAPAKKEGTAPLKEDARALTDRHELECFNTFLSVFKRQQEFILLESKRKIRV